MLALAETQRKRSGVSFVQKMNSYTRQRMIRGVDSKSATHKEIKCVLEALNRGASKLKYEDMLNRL